MLMKASVLFLHGSHHLFSDTLPLMIWVYQHVRKVNDKMAIRNCVADANELAIEPRSYKAM